MNKSVLNVVSNIRWGRDRFIVIVGKFENAEIAEYVRKFGSASRFVQKIIDSLDCPFAIVNVATHEIEITNSKEFFPGMKCQDLFKCAGGGCNGEKCLIKRVVAGKNSLVSKSEDLGVSLELHAHPIFGPSREVVSVIIYGFNVTQSQALVESEEKFHSLFEENVDAIFIANPETKVLVDCNKAALELIGCEKNDIVGKLIMSLSPEDKVEEAVAAFARHAKGRRVIFETEIIKKDMKTRIPVSINSSIVRIGGEAFLQGIFRNISEAKRAEDKLRELREYLDLQIERMPIGSVVWDAGLRVKSWNPAATKIFGFSEKEAMGKHPYDIIVPKSARPVTDKIWARLLEENVTVDSVNENITKGGDVITCSWSNTPLKAKDGKTIGVLSMVQDITKERKAEAKLKEREEAYVKEVEERFYNMLQNSQDLVYRYDFRKNAFDYVSESVFTILGYPLSEFMRMKTSDYDKRIHPDDMGIVEDMGDVSEEESTSVVEYRFKKKNGGYIWIKVQRVFFRNKKGELIYVMGDIRDISDRKRVEDEKVGLEERLIHIKNKSMEKKERISLTDREKLVLWGFCRYPMLNDEELATKLDLKRSTLTAIKNRLKGIWFDISYIPNFNKLGCEYFSILDANFKKGEPKSLNLVKKTPNVVWHNYQDGKLLAVFTSEKYVDIKRFLEQAVEVNGLKYKFNENSFFYDLDDIFLYDASGLVNSLFGLKRKERSVIHRFKNGVAELSINEKRVLHAMVKDSDMSSSEIAKKIWTSKPTVIKVKKKLLDEGYLYPYVVPNFKKMGFSHVARFSLEFDSDLSEVAGKNSQDARVILKLEGKKKMTKIMLFAGEEEYEEEIELIKGGYRKRGIDFRLDSDIFSIQKRRAKGSGVEAFISERLFEDDI